MSTKRKCCCLTSVGPCACSPGAPWVAGLGTAVRLRVQFAGISVTGPSLPWGCIKSQVDLWYGATTVEPIVPGFCGIPIDAGTNLAFQTSVYNEGNTWRLSGSSQNSTSTSTWPRDQAACNIDYTYEFSNGPFAYPDFGSVVAPFQCTSTVSTSIFYDATNNQTTIAVTARTVNVDSRITWSPHYRVSNILPGYCTGVEDTGYPTQTRDIYATGTPPMPRFFIWFSNTTTFAGKICGAKTYTLSNTAPAHVPYFTSNGFGYGGSIRICSSGTCAISLA